MLYSEFGTIKNQTCLIGWVFSREGYFARLIAKQERFDKKGRHLKLI